MDASVKRLRSTTFSGRQFRRTQLEEVRQLVLSFPRLSRNELALTVCELLVWAYTFGGCLETVLNAKAAVAEPKRRTHFVSIHRYRDIHIIAE